MRRIYSLATILACLLFLFPMPVCAQGSTTYDWADAEVSISIPNDYYVFTLDMPADDPAYANSGMSKEFEDKILEEGGIYLIALSEDLTHEIFLVEVDSDLEDFSTDSDGLLAAMAADLRKTYEGLGRHYLKSEIYQHKQTKFIKFYFSTQLDGGTAYEVMYYTVNAGKEIAVTLSCHDGIVGEARENTLQGIVDSIYFQKTTTITAQTAPFVYTDPSCGLCFTVPAGWKAENFTKGEGIIQQEFNSVYVQGLSILYWCTDYFSILDIGNREEVDTIFPPEEAIQVFANGSSEDNIPLSKVTYGGKEYSKCEKTIPVSFNGLEFDVIDTCLFYAENGYLFYFRFAGTEKDPYYKDLEALLNSAVYPTFSAPVRVTETPSSETAEMSTPPSNVTVNPFAEMIQPTFPISPDLEENSNTAANKTETPASSPLDPTPSAPSPLDPTPSALSPLDPTPSAPTAGLSVGSGMVIVAVSVLVGVILALAVWTLCFRRSLLKENLSSVKIDESASPAPISPMPPEEPQSSIEKEELPEKEVRPPHEESQPFQEEAPTFPEEIQQLQEEIQTSPEEIQPSPEEIPLTKEELQQPQEEVLMSCEEVQLPPEAEEPSTEDVSEIILPKQALFCYNCGAKLPPDSVYCQACGTKIDLEDEEE